jgi:lysophospholipase L1-like esterase
VRVVAAVLTVMVAGVAGSALATGGVGQAFSPGDGAKSAGSRQADQNPPRGQAWVASWTASPHGPYPSGNPSAQPALETVFQIPAAGASDQTFRLVIKPDLWGATARIRFTNVFGTRTLNLDGAFVGLQTSGGNIAAGTNRALTFGGGKPALAIPPGSAAYTDPVTLPFGSKRDLLGLAGRKLAVSFHVAGESGPMTWHAKALTTSYVTSRGAGSRGRDESDAAFPHTTTSWYFVDEIDVTAPEGTAVVACFGDSITDGTGSTLNGDDRWPDVLSRRLHAAYGERVSVVNAGIGGNRVLTPMASTAESPFAGGPSALARLDRDVLGIAGLSAVVWLEGINDISNGASAAEIIDGLKEGVKRLRARTGIRIIGGTIVPALGATGPGGTPAADARRQEVNAFIRGSGVFDGVADFDAVTRDARTGELLAAFQPGSTIGGPGDRLHPNRAGYQAMGTAIDLALIMPPAKGR